ncbi:MAG TPA: hypothetical protein VFY49_15680 [Myxococcota bacterium]|nr:hypothetical protein [Myxococcota bacterium]
MQRALARIAALGVLLGAVWLAHVEIFRTGAAQFVPLAPEGHAFELRDATVADVTYETWLVARHARTWLRAPWRLFDTEHCAPAERTLTYGVPMLALGLLGAPVALFTREPALVYNAALVAWSAVAALSMYVLVAGWTGRRAAGVGAALFFAFDPLRLVGVHHPAEWDIAWTALALFFAERLFASGRWRDAAGLGAAGALQVATSFYTLFAATLLAVPLGLWLLLRRAPIRATAAQLAVAGGSVALAALLVLTPYLEARSDAQIGARTAFIFASGESYLPGGPFSLGWVPILCALVGCVAPRRLAWAVEGDPRAALLAAAVLVALVAAGPHTAQWLGLPVPAFDPYALLASFVPGLDSVRVVTRLVAGVHLVLCVLAGAGLAAAICAAHAAGRAAAAAASLAVVVLVVFASFGGPTPLRWQLEPVRPSPASIDFSRALAEEGESPLLEVPLDFVDGDWGPVGPQRILLSAWHGRRTSACFGSYRPTQRDELAKHARELPYRWAVDEVRRMGFGVIVVHHDDAQVREATRGRYAKAIREGSGLRALRESETMDAYEILPVPAEGASDVR